MTVKKDSMTEDVPRYEGLANSRQTFHAVGSFEVVGGTVVLRVPDEMKRINPRKYRDRIYTVKEAVDRYRSMGLQIIKLKEYGVRGADELSELLDDFGAKTVEAIEDCRRIGLPVSASAAEFAEKFQLWKSAKYGRSALFG